jgi:hypothetical protein
MDGSHADLLARIDFLEKENIKIVKIIGELVSEVKHLNNELRKYGYQNKSA